MRFLSNLLIAALFFVVAKMVFAQEMALPDDMGPVDVGGIPEYIVYIGGLLVLVIEYLLGKTKLISPNSILDIVLKVILKILQSIFASKDEKK